MKFYGCFRFPVYQQLLQFKVFCFAWR